MLYMAEAETVVLQPQPKESRDFRQTQEARKDSPLQVLGRAWLCRHLDFRVLAPQTVR